MLRSGARYGNINLVNIVFLHAVQYIVASADDRHTVDIAAPFAAVIVDEATHIFPAGVGLHDVPQNEPSGRAGADDHDTRVFFHIVAANTVQEQHKAIEEPPADDQQKLQNNAGNIIGYRHPLKNSVPTICKMPVSTVAHMQCKSSLVLAKRHTPWYRWQTENTMRQMTV